MKEDNITSLIIIALVTIIVWVISPFVISLIYSELSDKASLGDSFGTINSLFSGLAFAGIIYTILLQRKELSLQREELKNTREELKRTADAQEDSLRMFRAQIEQNDFKTRYEIVLNLFKDLKNEFFKISALKGENKVYGFSALEKYIYYHNKYKGSAEPRTINNLLGTNKEWLYILRGYLILIIEISQLKTQHKRLNVLSKQVIEFYEIYLKSPNNYVLDFYEKTENDNLKCYTVLLDHHETILRIDDKFKPKIQ